MKLKEMYNDELTRNGAIMFAASTIVGMFNYIYQVYMGRKLGPEEYSVFGALFAIFYMIGIISQTLSTSTTRFVSKFVGEGKQIGFLVKKSMKQTILLSTIVSILFLLSTNIIMKTLKLTRIGPVFILAFILFLTGVTPILDGSLRGIKKFTFVGITNISNAFFKMAVGVSLVVFGFGVGGALLGVAIGLLVALVLSYSFVKPYLKPNNPHEPSFRFSSFYTYSLPVLFAMICYSVPSNLDVILAKYFFSAIDAGFYTSVSVLGKIIFFFSTGIGTVMFSTVVEKRVRGENVNKVLKKSLIQTGVLSGLVLLVYILFPKIVVIVFGQKYLGAINLVIPYGIAMFSFSIVFIFINFHLAIKNINYISVLAVFTFLEIFLLLKDHSTMLEMVNILAILNLAFLIGSIFYTWRVAT